MKRILWLAAIAMLALTLAACGSGGTGENNDTTADEGTDETTNEDQNNNTGEQDSSSTNDSTTNTSEDMQTKMENLDYGDFELSVEYEGDTSFDASLETNQKSDVDAELEDDQSNVDINGQEAFDQVYPNVNKLSIDAETSKEDAIQQTLDAFSLESNYEEFELEITFKDGEKIEFED